MVEKRGFKARSASYVPDRGDFIWIDFDPQAGKEQAGRRPALVLSPRAFNQFGLAFMCSITSANRSWPLHTEIPDGLPVSGFVQAEQMRSASWQERNAEFVAKAPKSLVDAVLAKVRGILD